MIDTKYDYEEKDDRLTIKRTQDVEPYIEDIKNQGNGIGKDIRHAASYPDIIVEIYLKENGITWHEFLANPEHGRRMMRDPDLSKFRIWKGKV